MSRWMGWGGRGLGSAAALALLTHCGGEVPQAPEGAEGEALTVMEQQAVSTLTVQASADTYVDATVPNQNFGSAATLMVDQSPQQRAYLRFEVSGLLGQVTRAKLRLYVTNSTVDGPKAYAIPFTWTEAGLTWNNALQPGPSVLDDKGALSSGSWVEYDVTAAVSGDGPVNLVLQADSSDGVDFASRNNSQINRRPQLVLTVDSARNCMPRTELRAFDRQPSWNGTASQAEPNRRFGSAPNLMVDQGPTRLESYLLFGLNLNPGWNLRQAKLRLLATDGTNNGPLLYRTSPDWAEDPVLGRDVDWNHRPALMGGPLANFGAIATNSWVEHDVTGVVTTPNMPYSFALLPESTDGVDFTSNHTPGLELQPHLRMTIESDPYCTYRGAGGGLTGWVKHYGGAGTERLHAMATDAQGGFVSAGQFGDAPFPNGRGFALARYNASGTPLWTRQVTTASVSVTALTLTPEGNILVAGLYTGAPDLGSGPLDYVPNGHTLFIAKFSPSGQTVWARGFLANSGLGGDNFYDLPVIPTSVATDAQGSLVVVGNFYGVVDFGGGPLHAGHASVNFNDAYWGGFLAKFTWQGDHAWSRVFETQAAEPTPTLHSVSTDAAGNVLVGGRASGLANLGDGPLGQPTPFIARYSPQGALQWKRVFSYLRAGAVTGVRATSAGGVAFIADLGGTFLFNGVEYTGANDVPYGPDNHAPFVGTLSASGADGWLRPTYPASLLGLVTGSDGSVTVSGHGYLVDLGGGELGTDYILGSSGIVAQYSSSGMHRWSRLYDRDFEGGEFYAPILHLAARPGGAVLVGTDFSKPVRFDGTTYTPRGAWDLFYFQLAP